MQWYLKALRQYVDFGGRARRTEFWMFTLISTLISIVLAVVDYGLLGSQPGQFTILGTIYSLAVLLPTLAVGVRRLHDTDRTGWWYLIALIPLIGVIVLIVFWATQGQQQSNRFGPDPKMASYAA